MMSVLVEGEIIKDATIEHIIKSCDDYSKSRSRHSNGDSDSDKQKYTSIKDMKEYSCAIGGEVWEMTEMIWLGNAPVCMADA